MLPARDDEKHHRDEAHDGDRERERTEHRERGRQTTEDHVGALEALVDELSADRHVGRERTPDVVDVPERGGNILGRQPYDGIADLGCGA